MGPSSSSAIAGRIRCAFVCVCSDRCSASYKCAIINLLLSPPAANKRNHSYCPPAFSGQLSSCSFLCFPIELAASPQVAAMGAIGLEVQRVVRPREQVTLFHSLSPLHDRIRPFGNCRDCSPNARQSIDRSFVCFLSLSLSK